MSRRCELTGRTPGHGKNVSHSHVRTSRRVDPNVQDKCYRLASENRTVRLQLSTRAIKTIDRDGIESVIARLRAAGQKI